MKNRDIPPRLGVVVSSVITVPSGLTVVILLFVVVQDSIRSFAA